MFAIKNSSRQRRSFQPALENLEDRCVPAGMSTPDFQFPTVQYNYLPAVQSTDQWVPSSNLALQMYSNWLPAFPPADPTFAGAQPLSLTKSALTGILLPAGTPNLTKIPVAFPAVQDYLKADPQPVPPMLPVKLVSADFSSILVGMLNQGVQQQVVASDFDWARAEDPNFHPPITPSYPYPNGLPAVQEWLKVGPQPIPPTKLGPVDASVYAGILVGML